MTTIKALAFDKMIEVNTTPFKPSVGSYCVYDGKIWYATSASGAGINYRMQ